MDLLGLWGGTWTGRLETVTIQEVVRQAGPRVRDAVHSTQTFRIATIAVSPDGLLSSGAMAFYSYFAQRTGATEEALYDSGFARGMAESFYLSTRSLGTPDTRTAGH